MTAQSTASTDRLPIHYPARPADAWRHVLRLNSLDWGGAPNPGHFGEDGFAVLRFDTAPETPARTRRFLSDTLTGWRAEHMADEVGLVAAELVANAIRHALGPRGGGIPGRACAWIALVRRGRRVMCAVADSSPVVPVPRHADELAESGRGLCIVAALSEAWGCSPPDVLGKTVWARIAPPAL